MDTVKQFYDKTIYDACKGSTLIHGSLCHIGYNTIVPSMNLELLNPAEEAMFPTLVITNKKVFDELLTKYISIAKYYYKDENLNESELLSLLFVDATLDDFNNPIKYISKKINFIMDNTLDVYSEETDLGYSSILDGDICVKCVPESAFNETPKSLVITLRNGDNEYKFPTVRLGISDNKAYIYTMQKEKTKEDKTDYEKRINRHLFKIGEGFNLEGNEELKDVSASFVVAANITVGLLERNGITEIEIPSIRMVRWNNKSASYESRINKAKNTDEIEELRNEENMIQANLVDKFLRTFNRVCYHNSGLDISSYPYETDSSMHIINEGKLESNNELLAETYQIASNQQYKKSM